MQTAISAENIVVELGGRTILDDVSFDVKQGEFVAVLGPNGAGKTTLFKVLLGLIAPVRGKISVLGKPPRRGAGEIGYTPQHRVLETDLALRARDVVGFGLDGNKWGIGFGGRKRNAAIDKVLDEVGVCHLADAPVGRLSGGEQQQMFIAQALISNPGILMLDEPLSNLDISRAREIVALLAGISRNRGVSVMLISHDINPLLHSVDRVLYLAGGHGVMGAPQEVITSETLSMLYSSKVDVIRSDGRIFVAGAEI
ncbi:MAG: metal ABC transporter ATP-binding protein [Nitrospiraceae bacterium]|nr:metal ABC transporter ATP-binding protein [Nitrospiraceae bacterium]